MCRHTPTGLRYRLAIPGKVCASVPLNLLLRFFEVVNDLNDEVVCSRIDICVDDFTKRLTFDHLSAALKDKNYSGFRTCQGIQNYDDANGWTIYLGSRQSEHMVRIYNKSAESLGRVDSIRWESEYKGEKANAIFKSLARAVTLDSSVKLLKGYVLGKVQFIDRSDKNLERCNMLDWWLEFVMYLGYERCQVLCEKPVTSIESKVIWIKKQVEKALALVSRAYGSERFQVFVDECVASGGDRLRRFDELLLIEYLNGQMIA
jgi:DNA relaxase NicK